MSMNRRFYRQLASLGSRRFASSVSPAATRPQKYLRRVGYFAVGLGAVWAGDNLFNASSIARNARTLWTCAAITLDYKLNFTQAKNDEIPELHQRVADRLYNLLTSNGGLYIKMGQAIGANAALLPKPIQAKFAKLFDDAPQVPYETILSVFTSEFGRPPSGPDGVFEVFEEQAVASASIAQVHRAKLWPEPGDTEEHWVAVKVQKPAVAKQMEWDLGAYRLVMWAFENLAFDLPVYFVVDFISEHLRRELDFVQEAASAQETARMVASEPRLSDSVYIPRVYPELSTKRVMTAEWIDGVRLSDREGIKRLTETGDRPLRGGIKAVMQTMVELFSAQMFSWGWVHCDPHPGNVIIRPHPRDPRRHQLVLLDHGLYVRLPETFRIQYAHLWKGLLAMDLKTVEKVTTEWGIGSPDLFASATLLRPVQFDRGEKSSEPAPWELTQYEQSVIMKEKLREFLTDTDKLPKELVFLGRNMRIVQGKRNNQALGSPVNRIRITGYWASRSLTDTPNLSLSERFREYWYHAVFRSVMFSLDAAFVWRQVTQWVRGKLGLKTENFEEQLERYMQGMAKNNFGIEVEASDMFAG
ncbi:hypothetical protein HGRIS_010655 [Hohenbuehelia grisea]|uniref:ABC1 atypical kinase-like domain-containing protein n=1 Tax=Hohenbuehelia grisea TaxID=104357 RepID=A0ABR3IXU9_9AGAR